MSGPGFGLEAIALNGRRALRAYFSGQNIALGAIAVPLVTAICFGLAAVAKHPLDGFVAVAVGWLGSARAWPWPTCSPSRWPTRWKSEAASPYRATADITARRPVAAPHLLGVGVAVTPVILAAVFTRTGPAAIWMPVLVLGGAAYGLA